LICSSFVAKRLSEVLSSPRQSIRNAAENSFKKVLPGVVVTSSRSSRRRISSAAATQAFAVATSGESPKTIRTERLASNPGGSISGVLTTTHSGLPSGSREQRANDYTIVNTASTMRVLNVLRHWLTKHPLVNLQKKNKYFLQNKFYFLGFSYKSQVERSMNSVFFKFFNAFFSSFDCRWS